MIDDKLAEDLKRIDPRFRLPNDSPECICCGKVIRPEQCVTVEGDAFCGGKAHAECASNLLANDPIPPTRLFNAVWRAIRAGIPGTYETPNPNSAVVHGKFL